MVADIIDIARSMNVQPEDKVALLGYQPESIEDTPVLAQNEFETSYYLRMLAEDRPGVLADITRLFADKGISIEAVIQKEPQEGQTCVSLILLSSKVVEKNMDEALVQIEALDSIQGSVTKIRMEHLG